MDALDTGLAIGFGWTFFSGVFLVSRAILRANCERLGVDDRSIHTISARLVSGTQGVMACLAGGLITASCDDVMNDRHWLAGAYVWFGVTYLYFDTCIDYISHVKLHARARGQSALRHLAEFLGSDPGMTFHHVILPVLMVPVVFYFRQGIGDYFLGCFMFVELVLPFKTFRDVAWELKKTDSVLYVINGVLLVASFVASRFLIFPFMWKSYGAQFHLNTFDVPAHIPLKCNVGCLIYFLLNIHFLTRMYAQVKVELSAMFEGRSSGRPSLHTLRRRTLRS